MAEAEAERAAIRDEADAAAVTWFNGATLTLVAGVDVSYVKNDDEKDKEEKEEDATSAATTTTAVGCLVVLSFPSLDAVHVDFEPVKTKNMMPYVAGFLAKRELSPLTRLLRRCPTRFRPDVVFVDGNGVLHPAGFGLASHLGVELGLPTIGVGKNLHRVDGLDVREIRAACDAAAAAAAGNGDDDDDDDDDGWPGHALPLVGKSGAVWGAAVFGHGRRRLRRGWVRRGGINEENKKNTQNRKNKQMKKEEEQEEQEEDTGGRRGRTHVGGESSGLGLTPADGVAGRPVYVSVGHMMSLSTAVTLTKACSMSKIPEPVRMADVKSRQYIRENAIALEGQNLMRSA